MSRELVPHTDAAASQASGPGPLLCLLRNSENALVTLVLGAMVILPTLDMLLRPARIIVPASTAIVQHLTMVVGMLGGAIAAREGRLLSLSTLTLFMKGRWKTVAQLVSGSFAAAVTAILFAASVQFVIQQRAGGKELTSGVPLWIVLLVLPLGFSAVAARLLWSSGRTAALRAIALLLFSLFLLICVWPPVAPEQMVAPALIGLLLATLLGAPVFVTLGGAALILFWGEGQPISSVPIAHYQQVTPALLPAIPLFTLAGYFLAEGGASRRLIRVFQALTGHLRGGPAIAAVLVCAFFTCFTGASGVTILALGGLLLPVLLASGYSERNALGLLTSGGSLGLLWPPCLPMILYAIIAKIDIGEIFMGGLLPGLLLVILTSAWAISRSPRGSVANRSFSFGEAKIAIWEAKWELLLPAVALTALFGGFATTVEASALTAVYAFIVEVFIYRDLKITKDLPRVMTECGLLIGGVLLILGVALGFTNYMIDAQIPDLLLAWAQKSIHSPYVFLLALNLLLLIVGCLMDIYSAIVVVVPIIVPMGAAFGIHPVHLGIIFLANLELGYLTPPVGMNLFLSSYRFSKPIPEVVRSIVPILLVLLGGVLLITYLPPLSTLLIQKLK